MNSLSLVFSSKAHIALAIAVAAGMGMGTVRVPDLHARPGIPAVQTTRPTGPYESDAERQIGAAAQGSQTRGNR